MAPPSELRSRSSSLPEDLPCGEKNEKPVDLLSGPVGTTCWDWIIERGRLDCAG